MRRFFAGDEEGQALVLGALMFLTMLFFVGLAIDAGQLYVAKRTEQEAADAAAFAGAVVLYQGGAQPPLAATVAAAILAAKNVATQNGYTDDLGIGNMVVIVNSPPQQSVNYTGDPNHVEVIITHRVKTSLVPAQAAFNPVRARGVAGAESFNNGYALMALDQSCTDGGLALSPNEDIHLIGGGALINSCGANAVTGAGQTQDFTITPAGFSVDVVGGVGGTFPAGITVNTGIAPVPDPFAGVYPKPSVSGMPINPPFVGNVAYSGVYSNAPLNGVNLCGGIYILKGQGMDGDIGRQLTGTDPNTGLACNGLSFIFNTMSNYPLPGGTCDSIGRNGNHPISLRPMTTGQYANFGIYQDPACAATMQIGGVSNAVDAGGTLYLPSATVHMNGNPATIVGGQLIANRLDIQNGNLNITYSANNSAQPVVPRLSE